MPRTRTRYSLHEQTSDIALRALVDAGARFDYIFIDGGHDLEVAGPIITIPV